MREVCFLSVEESEKFFYVYDIYMNRLTRKMYKHDYYDIYSMSNSDRSSKKKKKEADPESQFSSDAFDCDPRGAIIFYAYGRSIKVQSMNVPESI